ncbi:hypothetical protein WJX82_004873 [Trebouxia sp. C0006]
MHEDSVDTALHCDLCSWGCCCECSGVSVPGARSHQFAVLRVGQELAKRGHNFTLLVSSEEALDKPRLGTRVFDGLHVATFQGPEGIGTQEWFVNQPRDVAEAMRAFQSDQMAMAEHLHADVATIQQLKDTGFDIYLKDCWYWPADVLEDVLSVVSLGTAYHTNMTFLQRTRNYLQAWLVRLLVMRVSDDHTRRFCIKTGQRIRSFEQGTTGAAAVIVSADWAIEHPFPMPPKVQIVGPILAEPAQPLPTPHSDAVAQHGTRTVCVAPTPSCGNCLRLTCQHTYEAAFHGKPVVSVPIMNEQPDNAAKAVYHGFGITVLPSKLDPVNGKPIQEAVTSILHNPAFLANAQQVQKRMSNPHTPAERAADIVEQVLATNGEDYLETRQSKLYWWQLALLDVKLFLGVAVSLLLCCASLVLCLAFKILRIVLHWARFRGAPPVSQNYKHKTT